MKLNLTRPLVVFDLETTGLDIVRDRIFQLSYIKVYPDGKEERENIFVNPGKEIPQEVVELTGTSNADVADKPTFKALAPELAEKFANCDFAGFNSNHFDLPMLAEEFYRAGINYDFSQCRLIDAQTIFQDTEATYRVLMGELDMYAPGKQEEEERQLENDMDVLAQFSKQNDNVDFAGRVVWKEMKDANGQPMLDTDGKPMKQEVFNFGKYKGVPVEEALRRDPGYYNWMLTSDFTSDTKQVLTRIKMRDLRRGQGC